MTELEAPLSEYLDMPWPSYSVPLSLQKIGHPAFENAVLRWFPLVERPRTNPVERWSEWQPDPNLLIQEKNADILKALVWLCAGRESAEVARALSALALSAYRKVPQVGPRCVRVGNACVRSLGDMPGTEGIGQLALLKVRVQFGTAQKGIEAALNTAAERAGLPQGEIEEMAVPAYGLQEVGLRRERLGEFGGEVVITGTSTTELRWIKPDGKPQKSVPKTVKEHHAEELKDLKAVARDIQQMLPAQRDRIESLYLEQKSWTLPSGTNATLTIRSSARWRGALSGGSATEIEPRRASSGLDRRLGPGGAVASYKRGARGGAGMAGLAGRAEDPPALQASPQGGVPAHRRGAHHEGLL